MTAPTLAAPAVGNGRLDPVRLAGPVAAVLAIGVSVAAHGLASPSVVAPWQFAVALVALAAGVPHGAVDHLALGGRRSIAAWLGLGLAYAAIAGAAAAAILLAPRWGFIAVVLMTIVHFGSGDASYAASHRDAVPSSGFATAVRIAAGGAVPIAIPLTNPGATETLRILNPELVNWLSPGTLTAVRFTAIAIALLAMVLLINSADLIGAIELVVLTALALIAPPLVSFAVYFAVWHALRHTARLAALQADDGSPLPASATTMARVAAAGMPALVFIAALTVWLLPRLSDVPSIPALLWLGLALVWGLTVPHMLLVFRLDRRALSSVT